MLFVAIGGHLVVANNISIIDQSSHCTCQSCTDTIWNTFAGEYTCGDRITYMLTTQSILYPNEESACRRIAGLEYSDICGACDPRTCDNKSSYTACGCQSCTKDILQRNAGEYTCLQRITWIQLNDVEVNGSEEEACKKVSNEYPTICGPECNPNVCPKSAPSVSNPIAASPTMPTAIVPVNNNVDYDANLYCFPPKDNRKKYRNVWNQFVVEVKEDMNVCGPGNNIFSQKTVLMPRNSNDLKLQYKVVNGVWTGSEVRVLPPRFTQFSYGTYRFSIKTITLKRNRRRIMKELPPSLVLGLFTWDPTDNYAIHENWNHEVDIEISRWNDTNAMDLQFLVQPPGSPQMKRFNTGANGINRNPGNSNIYEFLWNPGYIEWNTTAGGGVTHNYSTKENVINNVPDYIQCLPANVEVRLNLWNMLGSTVTPTMMTTNDIVEVIIDKFEYIPSNEIGIRDGNYCTKDCQCLSTSKCINKFCRPN